MIPPVVLAPAGVPLPSVHESFYGLAFSTDGKFLFLTVGDRQRFTPAQDPDQPVGKILRLTLDGKPAPGNPMAGKTGGATMPVILPPADTEKAKTAPVVSTFTSATEFSSGLIVSVPLPWSLPLTPSSKIPIAPLRNPAR